MISNPSDEDWDGQLTLVTGAPFSLSVDLHTPHFVARPDATGRLVTPTLTDAVLSQSARPGDRDGDGILDENDRCPDQAEDKDGWEDDDGCPDPDNDKDRIPDLVDKCPNDPETYNGFEDEDGCPDKGRVIVSTSRIEIIDNLFFKSGSAELQPVQRPVLEAIAATLTGNPGITRLAVIGHTDDAESDPIGLSTRRAHAVVAALVKLGVERDRLEVRARGNDQPATAAKPEDRRARSRLVSFLILKRSDADLGERHAPPVRIPTLAQSVATVRGSVETGAGVVRYAIESAVHVPARSGSRPGTRCAPVQAEEVYLFRPLAAVAGSEHAPPRA
jgi:outer membrane protein OmpA-like peptidoglycan-associated protein